MTVRLSHGDIGIALRGTTLVTLLEGSNQELDTEIFIIEKKWAAQGGPT